MCKVSCSWSHRDLVAISMEMHVLAWVHATHIVELPFPSNSGMISQIKKLSGRWKRETHTLNNSICHFEAACSMSGVCDRAVLTKAHGNTHGATDRREERRSVTDGQNVAANERRQDGVSERERKSDITAVKCVCAAWNREKGVKDGIRVGWVLCHASVLGCDVCFAGTFCPTF